MFHFRKWNKKLHKRYFLLRIFCAIKILFVTLPCDLCATNQGLK